PRGASRARTPPQRPARTKGQKTASYRESRGFAPRRRNPSARSTMRYARTPSRGCHRRMKARLIPLAQAVHIRFTADELAVPQDHGTVEDLLGGIEVVRREQDHPSCRTQFLESSDQTN